MSERDRLIAIMNACFILLFSILLLAQCGNEKRIKKMDEKQTEINRVTYERNERMDKELRLLSQDVRIHNNILLSNEYLEGDE